MLPGFARMAQMTRTAIPDLDTLAGYPHYFPLSMLSTVFWDNVNVDDDGNLIIRVTDQYMQEVPFHVVTFDQDAKTGALWFKGDVTENAKSWYIHFDTETGEAYAPGDTYGSDNVWAELRDAILLNENPETDTFKNHATGEVGNYEGNPTGKSVPSLLEQQAVQFLNDDSDSVFFPGPDTFAKFTGPVTFIFMVGAVDLSKVDFEFLFGNFTPGAITPPVWKPWRVGFWLPETPPYEGVHLAVMIDNEDAIFPTVDLIYDEQHSDFFETEWSIFSITFNNVADGVQADWNGEAYSMPPDAAVFPTLPNGDRRVGGDGQNSISAKLSTVLVFNGAMTRAQRNVFNLNWRTPADFWTVNMLQDPTVCVESQIDEEECLNSVIKG